MEVIDPIGLAIELTGSNPTYVYAAYAQSTRYYVGDIVRYKPFDYWIDYRCLHGHVSPASGIIPQYWERLRYSAFTGGWVANTTGATSLYPAWASGAAVAAGDTLYDPADQSDYIAMIGVTAGDNTGEANRPSALILSDDETLAARWHRLGPANVYALLDGEINTPFIGQSAAGAVVNPVEVWVRLGGDAQNQLANAYDFTGWSVTRGTVAANQRLGADGLSNNADDFNATSKDASIQKALTGLTPGARLSLGVWLRSPNVAATYFSQWDSDNPGTTLSSSYIALSNTWQFFNVICTVPASGKVTTAIGGGGTIQSSGQVSLWGAHMCLGTNYVDRLCVMGLKNCDKVDFIIHQDRWAIIQYSSVSALPAGTAYGTCKNSLKVTVTTPFFATDASLAQLRIYPKNPYQPVECGLFLAGQAVPFGDTAWGVSIDHLSYSRKERDPDFGAVAFLKRGSARRCRAIAYLDDADNGDTIKALISSLDGKPIFWDFNASDTDYDRLRLFGFHTAAASVIQGVGYETLALDVESLLEY